MCVSCTDPARSRCDCLSVVLELLAYLQATGTVLPAGHLILHYNCTVFHSQCTCYLAEVYTQVFACTVEVLVVRTAVYYNYELVFGDVIKSVYCATKRKCDETLVDQVQ